MNFPSPPTVSQSTLMVVLIRFPQSAQYTGMGAGGGPAVGFDSDGTDNPSYPPSGIAARNGSAFVTVDGQYIYRIISTNDDQPVNLVIDLLAEPAATTSFPLPAGASAWWPGDGNANDIISGHNGTMRNGASYAVGKVGQAFSLDGVDDYIRIADSAELDPSSQTGFTVEAWALTHVTDGERTVLGKGDPYLEQYVIEMFYGNWRAFVRNVDATPFQVVGPTIEAERYYHFALTWNGQAIQFFVNGQSMGTESVSSIRSSESFLGIGGRAGFTSGTTIFHFDGIIDEITTYNRALSAEEVRGIFNADSFGKSQSTPDIDVLPTSLDFGDVTVGQSKNLEVTVRNLGNAQLDVSGMTSTDAQFSVVSSASFSVSAGGQQQVTVRFTPSSAGMKTDTLSIASNDPDESQVTVTLSGNGIQPKVATSTLNPPSGTYTTTQNVIISCATIGATIRYTTNGADPTESDPTYTAPVPISSTTTLKARAFLTGWLPSAVADGTYIIQDTGILTSSDPPAEFALHQNYPNPFNPETSIAYSVKEPGRVLLKVFDLLGREVATLVDEDQRAGHYNVRFNASGLASGIYVYRIRMKDFVDVKKMVVLE
ncbi:MAG: chitobiase/beta-hexosaminidase C-terminal domain-containing protein [bacterium]